MPRKSKRLVEFARDNRASATDAERQLWHYLKGRQSGYRFRRQHPLDDDFIVDFFCPEVRVAIELDGSIHDEQEESDASRQIKIEKLGILVLRFRNEEVYEDAESVILRVIEACDGRLGLRNTKHVRDGKVPPPPLSSPVKGEDDIRQ